MLSLLVELPVRCNRKDGIIRRRAEGHEFRAAIDECPLSGHAYTDVDVPVIADGEGLIDAPDLAGGDSVDVTKRRAVARRYGNAEFRCAQVGAIAVGVQVTNGPIPPVEDVDVAIASGGYGVSN